MRTPRGAGGCYLWRGEATSLGGGRLRHSALLGMRNEFNSAVLFCSFHGALLVVVSGKTERIFLVSNTSDY